jgi:hypothetical protein
MSRKSLYSCFAAALMGQLGMGHAVPPASPLQSTPAAVAPASVPEGGHIQFEATTLDFGRAKCGDMPRVTFVFTNTASDQVLEIKSVQPQCGCTTAGEWTRRVEPGKSGSIPLQFNTANYSGTVAKFITVTTSDPAQGSIMLQLKGTVWRPIEVTPLFAIINIGPDATNGSTSARININLDEPVDLEPPESQAPSFAAEITNNVPGKEYTLVVRTVGRLSPGTTSGQIVVRTSSTNVPSVTVTTMAIVQPSLVVAPSSLLLPMGPLTGPLTNLLTIQNNSTRPVALLDPVVDIPGATVTLREQTPGKLFLATIVFPQGLEARAQAAAFSVKSDNPSFPELRIPIIQPPRPGGPLAPAPGLPPKASPPASSSAPPPPLERPVLSSRTVLPPGGH